METSHAQVIIVGAGPAGLATGAVLRRRNVPFVILERDSEVAPSWRRRYDRLHIHTPKALSALPFRPYPRSYPRYPSRDQLVEYLEDYAGTFELEPEYRREVTRCTRSDDNGWMVETTGASLSAPNVVFATGFSGTPSVPSWPGIESFPGTVIHSQAYVNGEPFSGKRVLVVGFGNSGAEIALDLWESGGEVTVAVRSGVNVVPRDVLGIPATYFALASERLPPAVADRVNALAIRLTIGNQSRLGLRKKPFGPFVQMLERSQIPVIDVGTAALLKSNAVALRGGIDRFEADEVVFADGQRERYDAVVLATGYKTGLPGLFPENSDLFDDGGRPRISGRESAPGLYFCGFTLTSTGFLRRISKEASDIGSSIAASQKRST